MEKKKLDLFEFLDLATNLLLELEDAVCKIEFEDAFEQNYTIIQESLDLIRKGSYIIDFKCLSPIIDHLRTLVFKRKNAKKFTPIFSEYLLSSSIYLRDIFNEGETEIAFTFNDPDELQKDLDSSTEGNLPDDIQDLMPKHNFSAIFKELKETGTEEDFRSIMQEHFERRNPLIIIIDDDPNTTETLEMILSTSLKVRLVPFISVNEALKKITSLSPDLVIVDQKMPEMTGIEFIENARKNLLNIPIIFTTGFLDKDLCLKALRIGADAIIEKPFSKEEVVQIVENCLKKYSNYKSLINIINSLFYQFSGSHIDLEKNATYELLNTQIKKLIKAKASLTGGPLKINITV